MISNFTSFSRRRTVWKFFDNLNFGRKIADESRRYFVASSEKELLGNLKEKRTEKNSPSKINQNKMPDYSGEDGGLGNFGYMLDDADLDSKEGDIKKKTVIHGFDRYGFEIADVNYRGAMIAFQRESVLWNVESVSDITIESLALIPLVKPPVELVILGTGKTKGEKPLPHEILDFFNSKGILVEHMDTINASATFNILNQEERIVAAALLPLEIWDPEED